MLVAEETDLSELYKLQVEAVNEQNEIVKEDNKVDLMNRQLK